MDINTGISWKFVPKETEATFARRTSIELMAWHAKRFAWWLFRVARLLLIVSTIVFVVFSALPSDPIRSIVGINASEEAVAALRHELGYDRPLPARYLDFVVSLFRWDFGQSLVTRRPVGPEFGRAYLLTLGYVGAALGLGVALSLGLLVLGALGPRVLQQGILRVSISLTSLPSLVVATSVGVIIVRSGLLGGHGLAHGWGFVLATVSLAVYPTFSLAEIALRARQKAAFSQTAMAVRSLGYTELQVFRYCTLRLTLLPWIGHLSNIAASLVAGSVIIEAVFSLPGLGRLLVQAVLRGDLPMVQGIVVASVFGFVLLDWTTRSLSERVIGRTHR